MPRLVEIIEGLWLRNAPYVNLLFPGYTREERGRLRAATLEAIGRRDATAARRSMEADVGRAADYLIALLEAQTGVPARRRIRRPGRPRRGQC